MINKLINRYKQAPLPVKASVWFLVSNAIQSGCQYLVTPFFLTRLLTTDQYGYYNIFLSWTQLIMIFATLYLHAGVFNNAMLKYPDRRDSYTAASQSLSALITIGCVIIYFLFSTFWDSVIGLNPKITLSIFLQVLCTEGFLLWSSRQRYEYKYTGLLIFTGINAISYTVFPVICATAVPQHIRLEAVVYGGVAAQAIFGSSFIVYNYVKGKTFFDKEFWNFSIKFNFPLIPHYLSGFILGQSDRVMINRYIGAAEAGIYSFTHTLSNAILVITTSINNAIVPYTYEKLKNSDFAKCRKIATQLQIIVGSLCLLLSSVAPELMKLLAPKAYYDAVYLVPVIAISVFFVFLYNLFANVEFFYEENRFISIASCVGAVTNIALNYWLLPQYGYYAAGYTTLFCYALLSASHYFFMRAICRKHANSERVYDGKATLALSCVFLGSSFGIMMIYKDLLIRYIVMSIILAVLVRSIMKISSVMHEKDREV